VNSFASKTCLASLAAPAAVAFALALACASVSAAQGGGGGPVYGVGEREALSTDMPVEVQGVDIVEHLGDVVPLDVSLTHDSGKAVTMRELLAPGRPVLLHFGYNRCPMLCSLVLNELVRGLEEVNWSAGTEFDVVSISVNPDEGTELAHAKKLGYLAQYERTGSEGGWHFLTGSAEATKTLADAVGFQYKRLPDGEYSHPAMVAVLSPDGTIVRYLYGVKYEPSTLRMALLEGSQGTIGTPLDRFILWCHQYSASDGEYVLFAFRLMQLGGVLTVGVLGAGIAVMVIRDKRAKRLAPPKAAGPSAAGTAAISTTPNHA